MNSLKQFLFTLAMIVGLSIGVSAQKNDDQKKPPVKEPPPIVNPGKKPPRPTPPREEDKPKKPQIAFTTTLNVED